MFNAGYDVILDDDGRVWPVWSDDLRERHDARDLEGDFIDYLICNLGHVRLRISAPAVAAHLIFRPGFVATSAVARVAELLLAQNTKRFVLELVGPSASHQSVSDFDDVVAILTHSAEQGSALRRPRFFKQPLSLTRLERADRLASLHAYYKAWKRVLGNYDLLDTSTPLFQRTSPHYRALIYPGHAKFVEIGTGYKGVKSLVAEAQGRRIDDQADGAYAAWVSDSVLEASFVRKPAFEMIEATLQSADQAPMRSRYERLLLPWRSRIGPMVSSASVLRLLYRADPAT